MSSIITAGITPAMIPGIRKAIEVCEEFSANNLQTAYDLQLTEIKHPKTRIVGGDGTWSLSLRDHQHIHCCKHHGFNELASYLRHLIGDGGAA
ncbi:MULTISPECIES: hypothetical protein [Acetobacter]|uniref:Uncharacterized protein n=1 Tax=Acetobacter lambici TaxID=1332824 RepID=A0ABT1F036_9PROT|nr:hypothetical protein [Acetobacter lambici]MCP1243058.1 hypothetical protein [Acetobacter lambici]MCP1258566.1 hypothetical protein [Acetobacter lambici]